MPSLPLQQRPRLIKLSIETGVQSEVLLLELGLLVKIIVGEDPECNQCHQAKSGAHPPPSDENFPTKVNIL